MQRNEEMYRRRRQDEKIVSIQTKHVLSTLLQPAASTFAWWVALDMKEQGYFYFERLSQG